VFDLRRQLRSTQLLDGGLLQEAGHRRYLDVVVGGIADQAPGEEPQGAQQQHQQPDQHPGRGRHLALRLVQIVGHHLGVRGTDGRLVGRLIVRVVLGGQRPGGRRAAGLADGDRGQLRGHRLAVQQPPAVVAHLLGRLIAVIGALGERLHRDGVHIGRDLGIELTRRDRHLPDVLVRHADRGIAEERRASGQQLVEQAAGRIEVGARVDLLAPGLLGRQVLGGADHCGRLRHRRRGVGDRSGDPEVHHLDLAGIGQHHIGGLDVAVHDVVLVRVAQRVQHPNLVLEGALRLDRAALAQQVAQGVPLDQFHHDVGHRDAGGRVGSLPGVVDADDVRVVQAGSCLRLPLEAHLEGAVGGQIDAQPFDRDLAIQPQIAGSPDLGHAAASDDRLELVTASQDHWLIGHGTSPFLLRHAAHSGQAKLMAGPPLWTARSGSQWWSSRWPGRPPPPHVSRRCNR